jgi:hypothetical protein
MAKTPTPKDGCFQATHPSTSWQEVPCTTAPPHPLSPAVSPAAGPGGTNAVGNGADYSSGVSGLITWAEGSFPLVKNVTTESDPAIGGTYSLQLNTQRFGYGAAVGTSLCNNSTTRASCQGWEQFVYEPGSQLTPAGVIYIEYWLINYGVVTNGLAVCPAGWTASIPKGTNTVDCYINSSATLAPFEPITNLGNLTLTGTAGSSDAVTLSTGDGHLYTLSAGTVLNLNQHWQNAEFNVYGTYNLSQAVFAGTPTIVVQTLTDSATPTRAEATCLSAGYTGETNNLNLVPKSCCRFGGNTPGIQFMESLDPMATAPACPSLTASPSSLTIPAGSSATTLVSVVGNLVGQTSNAALQPSTCSVSGAFPATVAPASGVGGQDVTFSVPYSTGSGTYSDNISCDIGQSVTANINVGSSELTVNPGSGDLVQGTCSNFDLVWADPALAYCSTISYAVTSPNPLPAGITASISSAGVLSVCNDSGTPAALGTFNLGISSVACTGGVYTTAVSIDVVSTPPCQPHTCVPNSCQGTVPDGCGGTLYCPTSCSADYQCKTGTSGQAPICCAPTQIVGSNDTCVCPNGQQWDPGAGVIGACVPNCPAGESICPATGTCLTQSMCTKAETGGSGTCKPGTCS